MTEAPEETPAPAAERGPKRSWVPRSLLAIPAWVWFVIFFAAPVAWILYYSFGQQVDFFTQIPDVSHPNFHRYTEAFNPSYFPTFKRTLKISLIGTALCLIIALPFSYWLAVKVPQRWRGLMLGIVLVPFWTNFLVRTIGWQLILSPDGFMSSTLQHLGVIHEPLGLLCTQRGVQIGVVYNYLPLMILPLFVAFDRMDPALRESSKDLGASRWRTFTQVTLPIAMPGVIAGMLLVFIPLMGDYITAILLGCAKGSMAGQLVASQFDSTLDWSLGSAMAVMLILFILVTVFVFALIGLALRAAVRSHRKVTLVDVTSDGGK
ncbi:MAG TPA: ABC transporter permease [Actinomycetes bacterium]|nr:ABC transporter permease [Actinomycetes bacterium]